MYSNGPSSLPVQSVPVQSTNVEHFFCMERIWNVAKCIKNVPESPQNACPDLKWEKKRGKKHTCINASGTQRFWREPALNAHCVASCCFFKHVGMRFHVICCKVTGPSKIQNANNKLFLISLLSVVLHLNAFMCVVLTWRQDNIMLWTRHIENHCFLGTHAVTCVDLGWKNKGHWTWYE